MGAGASLAMWVSSVAQSQCGMGSTLRESTTLNHSTICLRNVNRCSQSAIASVGYGKTRTWKMPQGCAEAFGGTEATIF
ncbi:hypothetical protein H6G97_44555 [Nostoc flagelliforme FACHB-838]|uniref:Secreted protein n=1 Tax=Nostoc flagelliforme FACHB-838 TaxID=2692904 RepID=A0ABR8E4L4_9NOSO|nr:hypothetical protein [Nostoc flagelliforme]MBD2536022.1 hypothetical protein [Nostoc flagelliforme FACHB-838]